LLVDVHAPVELPELPAAVEVVAYGWRWRRVTNVAKHAGVDRARVDFSVDGAELTVTVPRRGKGNCPMGRGGGAVRDAGPGRGGRERSSRPAGGTVEPSKPTSH
jgi:signal transduction histidine kinase